MFRVQMKGLKDWWFFGVSTKIPCTKAVLFVENNKSKILDVWQSFGVQFNFTFLIWSIFPKFRKPALNYELALPLWSRYNKIGIRTAVKVIKCNKNNMKKYNELFRHKAIFLPEPHLHRFFTIKTVQKITSLCG